MALFDLLGRSWSMGVVWNLSAGPANFRELRARCESISPTILNQRLKELREARIVVRVAHGYDLTSRGRELYELLAPLGQWAKAWGVDLDEVNPMTQD